MSRMSGIVEYEYSNYDIKQAEADYPEWVELIGVVTAYAGHTSDYIYYNDD